MEVLEENLFEDKVASLKNAFYGLTFAELTYNINFNENVDYTSDFLTIMQNIICELENNNVDYDLTDLDSMGRIFSPTQLIENTDDTFNVLKIFPLVYLNLFKHDFNYSNENINFNKPKDFSLDYLDKVVSFLTNSINIKIKKSKGFPLLKYHDKVVFSLANYISNDISQDEIYCYIIFAKIFWLFVSLYYGYQVVESKNMFDIIDMQLTELKNDCKSNGINLPNHFEFLFNNFSKLTIDDINATDGFVNTIYSVIYSLNSNSFYESISKAINLENELGLTTAITGIIAGCYYKIDEDFDALVPIIDGNSKEKISFKKFINTIPYLNHFLNNFENGIVKEQIRQIIRFLPFFENAKKSDCYTSRFPYPDYPAEMRYFNLIVGRSLIHDRYVHSHYKEIEDKYSGKSFGKDYAQERKYLVDKANFHELKVCLAEYLRAEHMCEGWWGEAIDEKIFYIILLKFKDYYDSTDVNYLDIPVIDYKNISKATYSTTNKKSNSYNVENKPRKTDFEGIVITILLNKNNPLNVGNILTLVKEPDNTHDAEAIAVKLDDEKIGYVANSTNTVVKGTMSAGRVYDKINNIQQAEVILIDKHAPLARIIF